jgi:hypothetical protein
MHSHGPVSFFHLPSLLWGGCPSPFAKQQAAASSPSGRKRSPLIGRLPPPLGRVSTGDHGDVFGCSFPVHSHFSGVTGAHNVTVPVQRSDRNITICSGLAATENSQWKANSMEIAIRREPIRTAPISRFRGAVHSASMQPIGQRR